MAYEVFLGELLLPVSPKKLQMKINGQNKTITLINESEVNLLKAAKLTDISLEALLPQMEYPFARYIGGFQPADYFLEALEKYKTGKKAFQFIVNREYPDGGRLFGTDMTVSLEDYQILEDAENGFDVMVSISLKQYREFGASVLSAINDASGLPVMAALRSRSTDTAPTVKSYIVQRGDTLWNIAKKHLGDGSRYAEIYELNRDKITNPAAIAPGLALAMP